MSMNLINCDNCGTVFNADAIKWPDLFIESFNPGVNCEWDGDDYVSIVSCPVCKHPLYKP